MEMCIDQKRGLLRQLLHFGLHWMPVAEIGDYEEIPLSAEKEKGRVFLAKAPFLCIYTIFLYFCSDFKPYKTYIS
jgi:hypothetical protein